MSAIASEPDTHFVEYGYAIAVLHRQPASWRLLRSTWTDRKPVWKRQKRKPSRLYLDTFVALGREISPRDILIEKKRRIAVYCLRTANLRESSSITVISTTKKQPEISDSIWPPKPEIFISREL